jgi:general secretion pathway protein E
MRSDAKNQPSSKLQEKDNFTVRIENDELTEVINLNGLDSGEVPLATQDEKQRLLLNQVIDDMLVQLSSIDATKLTSHMQGEEMKSPKGRSLGEILLASSTLTQQQLDDALIVQKEQGDGVLIGEILLKKKYIKEDDLLAAVSFQLNMPILSTINPRELDAELVRKVPINFAKKHNMIPVKKQGAIVIVAISNTTDYSPLDDLRILLDSDVRPVLARKNDIVDAINSIYERTTEKEEELMEGLDEKQFGNLALDEPEDLLDAEDEAPIIRLVNTLMFRAVKERASDIHIEPFDRDLSVRYRIDGVLYEIMKLPKKIQASVASRIKIMGKLDIAEKRVPQDGRIKIKIAGKDIDIRLSTLPTSFGERIVMRLLDKSNVLLDIADIGFSKNQYEVITKIINKPNGIFLVTGPTGSGKTTTLYAALSKINTSEKNIITVEGPVEYQLQGIGQIHVNPKVNLTFANGLRSILRQDPDVIMVGEIRDLETAEVAIQASLTGHLVFSTLHTNDAAASITRLVDMGVEPFLVSSAVVGILAQRLVRVLCKECRMPYKPTEAELAEIGIQPAQLKGSQIFKARGCEKCWKTGYLGRMGIYELLVMSDAIRNLVLKNADANVIKKAALQEGFHTLREDGASKVLRGITTLEEVLRVTQEDSFGV